MKVNIFIVVFMFINVSFSLYFELTNNDDMCFYEEYYANNVSLF